MDKEEIPDIENKSNNSNEEDNKEGEIQFSQIYHQYNSLSVLSHQSNSLKKVFSFLLQDVFFAPNNVAH